MASYLFHSFTVILRVLESLGNKSSSVPSEELWIRGGEDVPGEASITKGSREEGKEKLFLL